MLTLFVRLGQEVFVYVQRTFGFVFLARHLPRLHDARREGAVGGAELVHGGARDGRHRRVRLPLAVRQRARAPAALPRRGGEPARRLRDRDRDGAARDSRSSSRRGSSSSSASARSRSGEQLRPVDISLRAAGVLDPRRRDRQPVPSRSRSPSAPGEPSAADHRQGDRRLHARAAPARAGRGRRSSRARTARSRTGTSPSGRGRSGLAGGIGVTPFLSMARSLGDATGRPIDFYYCVERARGGALPRRVPRDRGAAATTSRHRRLARQRRLPDRRPPRRRARRPRLVGRADLRAAGDDRQPAGAARRARSCRSAQIHAEEFGFAKLGRTGSSAPPRKRPVPLRVLAGALGGTALLLAFALVVAGYAA